ncbi:hypothetical protein BGZ81_008375 [Podila clonocystis]|nr:hypothetical protein BGZ81_008375 [Podila clonocystis]
MFTEDSINNSISHAIFNGSYAYPSSAGLDPFEGPVLQGNGSNSNSAINPNDSSNNEYSFLLDQPQTQIQPQSRQKRGREWSAEEIQGHYLDEVEEYQWSQTMAIRALLQQQTQQEQLQMRFDQQLGPCSANAAASPSTAAATAASTAASTATAIHLPTTEPASITPAGARTKTDETSATATDLSYPSVPTALTLLIVFDIVNWLNVTPAPSYPREEHVAQHRQSRITESTTAHP